MKYLEHVITTQGIQTDKNKGNAIVEKLSPKNVIEVLNFYQTCSWYRRANQERSMEVGY